MDFVYLNRNGENEELRYSLRSLKFVSKNPKVWIVGGKPKWLINANYIKRQNHCRTKWKNTTDNLLAACRSDSISEDFVLMNDDFFFLAEQTIEKRFRGYSESIQPHSPWANGQFLTSEFIRSKMKIKNPKCYELHYPMFINRLKFIECWEFYTKNKDRPNPIPHKRTLYGNYVNYGGENVEDYKIQKPKETTENIFVSTNDRVFNSGIIGKKIREILPDKSHFES